MKKFLPSLFLLALWCTGASADLQVSTDESSPEYIYTIRGGGINTSYFWSSTGANVYFASSARFAFYKKDSDTEEVYYI